MMKRIILFSIIFTFCGISGLSAEEAQVSASPSPALPFVTIPSSPRTIAMGGVSSLASTDAYAHFSDVAAVPFGNEKMNIGVSYNMWQPSKNVPSNVISLGATYNINERFGLTLGLLTNIGKAYDVTTDVAFNRGKYTPMDLRAGVGFSYRIIDGLSAGVAFNYAQSTFAPPSADYKNTLNAFAADVQVMYRVKGILDISVSANNLGTSVKNAAGVSFTLPMNAKLALGTQQQFGKHGITAGLDGGMYFGSASSLFVGVGAEYLFNDLLAVRAGYHYSDEKVGLPSFASVGLGLKFFGVHIDAAYCIASGPMKNTISVALGFSF